MLKKLEIFNAYIKTNLVIDFILSFKSSVKAFILFFKKLNNSFYLCINY